MLPFIGERQHVDVDVLSFKYIPCYRSSSPFLTSNSYSVNSNTSHVTVHPGGKWYLPFPLAHSNTSHVTVHRHQHRHAAVHLVIQIHPMLPFILAENPANFSPVAHSNTSHVTVHLLRACEKAGVKPIQIHPMLPFIKFVKLVKPKTESFKYIPCYRSSFLGQRNRFPGQNSNTSHVTVHPAQEKSSNIR